MELRPYQVRAVEAVREAWNRVPRVLLVAPTGAGKTVLGCALIEGYRYVLWLAHRTELVQQAAERIAATVDRGCVGITQAGQPAEPWKTIQVASIQTLLARGLRPPADVLVLDEAHHYAADDWSTLRHDYPEAKVLGLTATPERGDGRGLGELFDELIPAASYTELVNDQYLVPCRVVRPEQWLRGDIARDPIDAYREHTPGQKAFVFTHSIEKAESYAVAFTDLGFPAACISAETPAKERASYMERFRNGSLRVLTNVYALTEGVDVPDASVCLIARGIGSAGAYLQMVGRVLRPAEGKTEATLLDLSGASHLHGLPTQDRTYFLDGRAIRAAQPALSTCQSCGAIYEAGGECPVCGWQADGGGVEAPQILDLDLETLAALDALFLTASTPGRKLAEWKRLVAICNAKDWGLTWAAKQYRQLYEENPPATEQEKRAEYLRLQSFGHAKGYKPGWSAIRFKEAFAHWPRRVA